MADDLFDPADLAAALTSAEVVAASIDLAGRAADYWQSIAPVGGPDDPHAGDYRDSISVVVDGTDVAVLCESEYAHIIEFGSEDTPEFGCRARVEEYFNGGG